MGRTATTTSVPGEPGAQASDPGADTAGAGSTDQAQNTAAGQGADSGPDPRDAEIARLRAELAAKNAPAAPQLIMEGDGPNIRKHMAESKHLGVTSGELAEKHAAAWKRGKGVDILGGEHHVLCKDGWFVNPAANARESQN